MKQLTLVILVMLCIDQRGFTQQFSLNTIEPFVTYFEIRDNRLHGPGAHELKHAIANAQNVILGERHYSVQIAKLTEAMLPELAAQGFKDFVLEVGPVTGQILQELSAQPEQTEQALYKFNSQYAFAELEDIPIPFFDGKEDAAFLKKASELGFQLHGIDQEYYQSTFHLVDRMFDQIDQTEELEKLRMAVQDTVMALYIKDVNENRFRLFRSMEQSPLITKTIERLVALNAQNSEIADALCASWDIYARYSDYNGTSHPTRVMYLRENFKRIFPKQTSRKAFVKIGGLHAARTPKLNAYDIGDLVKQREEINGHKALLIGCATRLYQDGDELIDTWQSHQKNDVFSFTMFGKEDQFALIDLASIKKEVDRGAIEYPNNYRYHTTRQAVEDYDYLIILPKDREQQPNYDWRE